MSTPREPAPACAAALILAAVVLGAALVLHLAGVEPRGAGLPFVALYARLARQDLLAHPIRAAILERIEETPGIHLRELHRRVGGAWGAFRTHIVRLERAGYVTIAREGRYASVRAAGAPRGPVAITTPTARALFDALPADGSAVPVATLRVEGTSRQLANYHLRALAERGFVRLAEDDAGRRVAARTTAHAGPSGCSGGCLQISR